MMSNSSTLPANPVRPSWVLYRCCAYLRGKGIHYGSAPGRIFDKRAYDKDKFCIAVDPRRGGDSDVCASDLSFTQDRAFNWVFLDTEFLNHKDKKAFLKEAVKKLAQGGHVISLAPTHLAAEVTGLFKEVGGWNVKPGVIGRDGLALQIFKRVPGQWKNIYPPEGKRACIVRYGAFGDQVTITPLIRALKEDGYHVTVNISSNSIDVLKHNPRVDNFILQERDVIYNPELGAYWSEWAKEYDKYINLSESIEGTLLKVEKRRDFYTSNEFRRQAGNTNYYKHTLKLGGYPDANPIGELFFSPKEEKTFLKNWDTIKDKFRLAWVLKGSSYHKAYPLAEALLSHWLSDKPDAVVVTLGGEDAKPYDIRLPQQVISTVGVWNIRQSMMATKFADCVIGPETGVMNAAGCFDVPKIVLLSHSTPENICGTWTNVQALTPNTDIAPCYPCHQMHYSLESCPLAQIVDDKTDTVCAIGPVCSMGAISIETVEKALDTVYSAWKSKH